MADIRIKDLTTTASSTASDDFIAVDGTTNGTRKLNAFSPTFGGNATVTGTLTVNGATLTSTGDISVAADKGIYLKQGNVHKWTSDGTSSGTSRADIYADSGGAFFIRTGGATQALTISSSQGATFAGAVAIPATTASTTTSTGALVVGNGTSGGLGVGGSINAGGNVTISGSNGYAVIGGRQWSFRANSSGGSPASGCVIRDDSAAADRLTIDINGNIVLSPASVAASGEVGNLRIADSSNTNRKLFFGLDNTVSPNGVGYIQSTLTGTTTIPLQLQPLGGSLSVGNSGTVVTLNGTTASTSTSSGALVVSGGVGVAGKVTSTALGLANTSQSIPAWGDVGAQLSVAGAVITDTTSSGTVSRFVSNSIAASSIAASSPTTYTQAATLFIAAGPTANTNVTITNSYALFIAGGRINFGGLPTSSAGLQAGTLWNDGGTLKVA